VASAGDRLQDLLALRRQKPFQAMPLAWTRRRALRLTEDLALACASHSSEPAQVALVREFLQRVGCSERD